MTNKLILRLLIAILELLASPGTSPYHRALTAIEASFPDPHQ